MVQRCAVSSLTEVIVLRPRPSWQLTTIGVSFPVRMMTSRNLGKDINEIGLLDRGDTLSHITEIRWKLGRDRNSAMLQFDVLGKFTRGHHFLNDAYVVWVNLFPDWNDRSLHSLGM